MSLRFPSVEMEAAVALWGNTSLGLLLHWWQANKQQAGRGNIGKEALADYVMLDPSALSADQLKASVDLLTQMANTILRPFNEIHIDDERAELDRQFLIEILNLPAALADTGGALELLRTKLSFEPSVMGHKARI